MTEKVSAMTCHDSYENGVAAVWPERIVVGVDGSPASIAALRWADHEARRSGACLEVVAVVTPGAPYAFGIGDVPAIVTVDPAQLEDSARHLVQNALLQAEVHSPEVRLRVAEDSSPWRALIAAAQDATLLVLGAHRHHGLGVLLGSTAMACVNHATCPVVVVPAAPARAPVVAGARPGLVTAR